MQDARPLLETEPKGAVEMALPVAVPALILIPAGSFLMGTSDEQIEQLLRHETWAQEWVDQGLFQVEQPQHTVALPAYEIAVHPVTHAEYYRFVFNSGYRAPRGWIGFHYPEERADHPVVGVSKVDALAYCKWLSAATGRNFRLPTEAEWEKAARATDGRIYPWGNSFDPWRCNTVESAKGSTTPVGAYSKGGDSPYAVADMVGNVWEWTSTLLQPYPYQQGDGREAAAANAKCVVRGGAWYYSRRLARCAAREGVLPDYTSPALGFRLACTPK